VRTSLVVLGAILVLLGLVWVGQGLGYVRGSFMTGDIKWTWIGLATAIVGIVLAAAAVGRRAAR
jgi:hypothetical protein